MGSVGTLFVWLTVIAHFLPDGIPR